MDTWFQGTNECKVDGKGRVALPAKFRRALQASDAKCAPGDLARLYIAYGDPRVSHVECLSGDAYDRIKDSIRAMPPGSKPRAALVQLYFSRCEEVQVDEAGRFVLPPRARDKLKLDGLAVFDGKDDKFHILKPEDSEVSDDDLAALLDELSGGDKHFDPISLSNPPTPVSDPVNSDAP